MQKRSLAVNIILYIVTCGLWSLVWNFLITEDVSKVANEPSFTGTKFILLSLVTCGIYTLFWYYQLGQNLSKAKKLNGLNAEDNAVLYLILSIFGFGIIATAITQNELNKLADGVQ